MIKTTGVYYRFIIRAGSSAIFRNWTLLPGNGSGFPREKLLKRYTSNLHYCKDFSKCAISIRPISIVHLDRPLYVDRDFFADFLKYLRLAIENVHWQINL